MVGETKRFESSLGAQDFTFKKGFINLKTFGLPGNDDNFNYIEGGVGTFVFIYQDAADFSY